METYKAVAEDSEHTMSSPAPTLISLPQETQDQIWSYVIGHPTIHVMLDRVEPVSSRTRSSAFFPPPRRLGLYHARCEGCNDPYADMTPTARKMKSLWGIDKQAISSICHRDCKADWLPLPRCLKRHYPQQDVSGLFVCRRLYATVVQILYRNSIFAFTGYTQMADVHTGFETFCAKLSVTQSAALQAVHFRVISYAPVYWDYFLEGVVVDKKWQELIEDKYKTGIKTLTGLQVLSLEIIDINNYDIMAHSIRRPKDSRLVPFTVGFGGLKDLKLKELHVAVLAVGVSGQQRLRQEPWHITDRLKEFGGIRGFERALRKQLLDLKEEKGFERPEVIGTPEVSGKEAFGNETGSYVSGKGAFRGLWL